MLSVTPDEALEANGYRMNANELHLHGDIRRLSIRQKQQFSELGYITNLPLFDPSAVPALQRRFGELVQLLPEGVDISRVNNWHKANKWIYDLCHIPAILDYVEDLLGPDFYHWGASFFCKYPGDKTEVPWHQDAQYWPLHPHKSVTVWLALYDTDRTTGAMRVVRRSHRQGALKHIAIDGDHYMLADQVVDSAIDPGEIASLNLSAGQISLHDDAIVHGSPANHSDRMRAGLTIRYSANDVKCDLEVWPTFESYLARGVDEKPLNPIGKIPREDGYPLRPLQSSAEFA